jgi:hypothetical protein
MRNGPTSEDHAGANDPAPSVSTVVATHDARRGLIGGARFGGRGLVLLIVLGLLVLGGTTFLINARSARGTRIGQIAGRWQPQGAADTTASSAVLEIKADSTFESTTGLSIGPFVPLIGSASTSPVAGSQSDVSDLFDLRCTGTISISRSAIEFHTTSGFCGYFTAALTGQTLMIHYRGTPTTALTRIP